MTSGRAEELSSGKTDALAAPVLASNGAGEPRRETNGRSFDRRMLKKSDLYRSLWKGADELRGGMDASQYKDYVLTLLFVKYVSDRADKTLLEVPEGTRWADIKKLRDDKEIGDKINKIIGRLAEANDLHGVIDLADFNDENKLGRGKEMVDRLSKLVGIFDDLDFGSNTAEGDDLLGDAYEYLMRHFATESGKSKGQFYTPAEVSTILARVVGIGATTTVDQTVYDPTCGSGSLLLKAASEAPGGMSAYGQEMDNATFALAQMNLILHGYETAELWHGNTLASPHFKDPDGSLKKFDFAVANPPFSVKAWTSGLNPAADEFGRFEGFGVPPEKNGDYAFLLHVLKSLKSTGKAAVILPHGVLFRGNREGDIRRELIKRRLIKGIIGLPANLFYGTSIPACVVVLDKEDAASREGIFLVDASRGFVKDGNKNRLRAQDIHKIIDVFTSQTEHEGYSRLVPFSEIESEENNYNLNLPRYIDSAEPEDIEDLDAHLNGGIPQRDVDALGNYWEVMPSLRDELFDAGDRPGYLQQRVQADGAKEAILSHHDFVAFRQVVCERFERWRVARAAELKDLEAGGNPKQLIAGLSESLLAAFREVPLLDPYDIYQHLMDYWVDVMQDDVYLVTAEGWSVGKGLRACGEKETPDLEVKLKGAKKATKLVGEILPARLVWSTYFPDMADETAEREAAWEMIKERREAFEIEHAAEEGALDGLAGEKGITKAAVQAQVLALKEVLLKSLPEDGELVAVVKQIKKGTFGSDPWTKGLEDPEGLMAELDVLHDYLALLAEEAAAKSGFAAATQRFHEAVIEKYPQLRDDEIKDLVVDGKWLQRCREDLDSELDGVAQQLSDRLSELVVRYETTLPDLEKATEELAERVAEHLRELGFSWS